MNEKVLIITATCGEGHNSIAKALAQELELNGAETKICNLYEKNPKIMKFYNDIYLWACKRVPHIYDAIWHNERKKVKEVITDSPQYKQIKNYVEYYKTVIEEYKPTKILCTHVGGGAVISYLKYTNWLPKDIKTYSVFHDYTLCPYWDTNKYVDYCLTPAEHCEKDLISVGFKKNQIKCFGYPINKKFYKNLDKQEMRKKLGIEDRFTFMSIAGGNGLGVSVKFLKQILKTEGDYQVMLICGKNIKAKESVEKYIQKHNIKNVKVVGFVKNVEEFMSASDVCFARGGANCTTEALYCNLPIIFREGLIINEAENRDLFVENGCGFKFKNQKEIKSLCEKILNSPELIAKMRKNIKKIIKPEPLVNIVKFMLEK